MLTELLKELDAHKHLDAPPATDILLGQEVGRTVYIESSWGPPVPYPPAGRDGGSVNYGYQRLKGRLESVAGVPEVADLPEYQEFLEAINADGSPIESVGCEKSYFTCEEGYFPVDEGKVTTQLGSYTDVIFSDTGLNDDPKNALRLASSLAEALRGCEQWWSSAEFGLQRLKGLVGCSRPWGLMVRVSGYGRSEREARRTWNESIKRLSIAVSQLPATFPSA